MVERIDEREGRGAIEGPAVVKGGRDADRRLVDVRNAEVDFSHGSGSVRLRKSRR